MSTKPNARRQEASQQIPATIGFRLDEKCVHVLALRASNLGVSPHSLAKHYVELALQQPETLISIGLALEQLRELNRQMRDDIATTAVALLTAAGDATEDEARAWADQNLKHV
ncbi:MAG TPA: hypothetical protein P5186_18190 [Candidatus Paceibacterota bacterium]|nr:hypothetical protein [Verrucomicrobiota bacterium]HRY49985.1 hypothetical protein [Candidatus Paceibacterota bacterium]